jgi:hypothetical protein
LPTRRDRLRGNAHRQSGGSLRADGRWFNKGTLAVNNEGTLQQEQTVDGSAPVQFFAMAAMALHH